MQKSFLLLSCHIHQKQTHTPARALPSHICGQAAAKFAVCQKMFVSKPFLLLTAKKFVCDKNKYFLRCLCCNCCYILFNKLPWSRESERTFRFRVKLPHAQCPPVYHTRWRLHSSHCHFNC